MAMQSDYMDKPIKIQDLLFPLAPLSVYLYTCAPGIGFGDTAILIDNILQLRLNSQVNTHPLTVMLGYLFSKLPFGNPAFKANLLSVFAGTLSVYLLYLAVKIAIQNRWIASLTALAFMVSHSMWWHSTIIENYALNSALTGILLLVLMQYHRSRRRLWILCLFFLTGFGLFNHVQMAFSGAAAGAVFLGALPRQRHKLQFFLYCSLALVAGLLPWAMLLVRDMLQSGAPVATLKNAFFGPFGHVFFSAGLRGGLETFALLYLFQFPNLFILLPPIGIYFAAVRLHGSSVFWALCAFTGLTIGIFAFYETWDRFAFLLPAFMILFFFSAFSLNRLWRVIQVKGPLTRYGIPGLLLLSVAATPIFYSYVHKNGDHPDSIWYRQYNNNYSRNLYDHAGFIIQPDKGRYREVERFAELLFEKLPPGAIYLDDDSRTYYPLADYYQKYLNRRKDLKILLINSWGIRGWGATARHLRDELEKAYNSGIPFFMASLAHPYSDVAHFARENGNFEFKRYYLSEKQWIYKLETVAAKVDRPFPGLSGKSGYIDFQPDMVHRQSDAVVQRQLMTSFIGEWRHSDQLFVYYQKPDGFITITVDADRDGWVYLTLFITKAPDFSQIAVRVNTDAQTAVLDLYHPLVTRLKHPLNKKFLINKGLNTLKISINNTSARPHARRAGLDGLGYEFIP